VSVGPPATTPASPGREQRFLVLFLALGSAYFAVLLAERLLAILGGFSAILLVLFLAWLLAFVMAPLVGGLQARFRMSRGGAVGVTYAVALVAIGFILFYAGAAITQQVTQLTLDYPRAEQGILETLRSWQQGLGLERLQVDLVQLYGQAQVYVTDAIGGAIVGSAQAIAGVTIAALGSLLLILILSLYMLLDSERIIGRLKRVVPKRYSDEVDIFERTVTRAFGGFLRAQLILAATQAALVGAVGIVFGIPYLFLIGTLSALAMLIPFFGPPLALIPPIVAAALFNPAVLLPVTIILLVAQTVVVNWLQPRLMQGALGLHPILVLVGLLVGAQVAGVWGALFGIPVIAVLYVFASYLLFRALPHAALPEREKLPDVHEHTLVSVEKEQVGDETHPHIHVTRSLRPDGSEEVSLEVEDEARPAVRPARPPERDVPA
jgi:putative heme transporter